MNGRPTVLIAVLAAFALAAAATAPTAARAQTSVALGGAARNLDAEQGRAGDGRSNGSIVAWKRRVLPLGSTDATTVTQVAYGAATDAGPFPDLALAQRIGGGRAFFSGGGPVFHDGLPAERQGLPAPPLQRLSQTLRIPAAAVGWIAAGRGRLALAAEIGGFGSERDYAQLAANVYDARGTTLLKQLKLNGPTPAQRGNLTTLLERRRSVALPRGSRVVTIELVFHRLDGDYSDGSVDNVRAVVLTAQ